MISLPDLSMEEEALPKPLRPLVGSLKRLILSPLLLKALFPLVRRPNFVRTWASDRLCPTRCHHRRTDRHSGRTTPRTEVPHRHLLPSSEPSPIPATVPHIKTILPTLTVPMLLIWGQDDRMIPKQFARPSQYSEYNPHLQLLETGERGTLPS